MSTTPDRELRFADGPSTEVEVVIDAPADVVWALVTDIGLPARFSTEFQGAEWVADDSGASGPGLGRRFVGRNHHPAIGQWETTAVVVEYDPEQTFGWVIGEPEHPSASWRFTLTPDGPATRLSQWVRVGPAPSGINRAIDAMPDKEAAILRRRMGELHANMETTVQGVKDLAEGSARK